VLNHVRYWGAKRTWLSKAFSPWNQVFVRFFLFRRDGVLKYRLADLGDVSTPMTPDEFRKFIADETEKWSKVIRAANIKAE
jgi:hypothetical protein